MIGENRNEDEVENDNDDYGGIDDPCSMDDIITHASFGNDHGIIITTMVTFIISWQYSR